MVIICAKIPSPSLREAWAVQADVRDGRNLRREALACKVPIVTTLAGARATVQVCPSNTHALLTPCYLCMQRYSKERARNLKYPTMNATLCGCKRRRENPLHACKLTRPCDAYSQALAGLQSGPLEQVPIQDYFPAAKELSPVPFA